MIAARFSHAGGDRRVGLLTRIAQASAVRRQRRILAELSPERLRDIGISAEDARLEAERPVWDVPVYWLR